MNALKDKITIIKAAFKITIFLMLIALFLVPQLVFKNLTLPCYFHRFLLKILNVKVKVNGKPEQALFISNHLSWLDIVVLGSITPLRFIAKKEVESWFLFGFLAKLQQTIFVERENRTTLIASKTIIEQALQTSSVVLFAEGTTTDGTVVLPFNSSFVSNPAQAVCIHYKEAAKIAWFGDMTLTPHLWQVFKLSKIEVSADFLECYLEGNRKFIAESAQKIVSAKHQETIMKNV